MGETKIYNYHLARKQTESNKHRFVIFIVLLSFIPFGIFVYNAEDNFRKAEVKKLATKRRERLDQEHGIDRD